MTAGRVERMTDAAVFVRGATPAAARGDDPLWYKDAIIYEAHVRAFYDGNGDGVGDFRGLTAKLDYIQDLGVTAVWILPFYPSPLKDDGYDIADYTAVNPDYGALRDVRTFIREAHRRGLRVITELVCNHTSDQHPWFQRARRAPAGSVWRDFYVWSDTDERYRDARIIFKDFERSNWAWDPVAGAYYWHRFYSHQPDLNFENPRVRAALFRTMDFWLEMGVDGLRLDAVPYLYEREGTNCENLPETHAFLRSLRRHIDEHYTGRMLLAEANQWPEDAVTYLGGDECQMSFHFPVMPRMFMALRLEDRFPIIDILEQTPPIPEEAQWALFLRNHDELTLEMVTDEERDYMYRVYAHDPQMRLNLGIRRRLAPLLGNNRRRIELMNGLLFSLPGTPVLYYGDEIGMGDNVYLGDRNGVRTPMQWSGDRNAGFSGANRQRMYLPVITDPEYHYEAINVEAQQANPHSLLWWMKRLIALRKQHQAFGRGDLQFLQPDNRKVLSFVRTYGDERILVVANLSRYVQYAELDLEAYRGFRPVEMFGRVEFPRVGDRPFVVTLGPHSFYWFLLERPDDQDGAMTDGWDGVDRRWKMLNANTDVVGLLLGPEREAITKLLPAHLATQRWFRSKSRSIKAAKLRDIVPVPMGDRRGAFAIFDLQYVDAEGETYVIPLALARGADAERLVNETPNAVLARVALPDEVDASRHDGHGDDGWHPAGQVLYDALDDPSFGSGLLEVLSTRKRLRGAAGQVIATPTRALRSLLHDSPELPVAPLRGEQTNTSVVFGDRLILKLIRRVEAGVNPDSEVRRALSEAGFPHMPPLAGTLEYQPSAGESAALGILQGFVPNEGDAWAYTLDSLSGYYERAVTTPVDVPSAPASVRALLARADEEPDPLARDMLGTYLEAAWRLGTRTAELHRALASRTEDAAFAPEPFLPMNQRALYQSMRNQARESFGALARRVDALPPEVREVAHRVLAADSEIHERLRAIAEQRLDSLRIRCHGDYHLGQVLFTGRDFVIIDYEGEPNRALSERRHKRTALTDVAGMLRSLHYASRRALLDPGTRRSLRPEDVPMLEPWARFWYASAAASYLRGYLGEARDAAFVPARREELETLLDVSLLHKAVYEVGYELDNRPDWVTVPLLGIEELALRS